MNMYFSVVFSMSDLKPNPTDKHHETAQKRFWYELQCMATEGSVEMGTIE